MSGENEIAIKYEELPVDLAAQTVVQLKALLKARGLKVGGRKVALIARLDKWRNEHESPAQTKQEQGEEQGEEQEEDKEEEEEEEESQEPAEQASSESASAERVERVDDSVKKGNDNARGAATVSVNVPQAEASNTETEDANAESEDEAVQHAVEISADCEEVAESTDTKTVCEETDAALMAATTVDLAAAAVAESVLQEVIEETVVETIDQALDASISEVQSSKSSIEQYIRQSGSIAPEDVLRDDDDDEDDDAYDDEEEMPMESTVVAAPAASAVAVCESKPAASEAEAEEEETEAEEEENESEDVGSIAQQQAARLCGGTASDAHEVLPTMADLNDADESERTVDDASSTPASAKPDSSPIVLHGTDRVAELPEDNYLFSPTESPFIPHNVGRTAASTGGKRATNRPPVQQAVDIGTRVVASVGSTSVPGVVKYVGETQFAPGVWFGVALDTPNAGKHDGTVRGVRYFHAKRGQGVFVRRQKIRPATSQGPKENRKPAAAAGAVKRAPLYSQPKKSNIPKPGTKQQQQKQQNKAPMQKNANDVNKKKTFDNNTNINKSKPSNIGGVAKKTNTSESNNNVIRKPTAAPSRELRVGSHVTIRGRGERAIVRFIGETKFGDEGEWIGLELAAPHGKNDGSVQGHSYFKTKPKHGMFVRRNRVTVLAHKKTGATTTTTAPKTFESKSNTNARKPLAMKN